MCVFGRFWLRLSPDNPYSPTLEANLVPPPPVLPTHQEPDHTRPVIMVSNPGSAGDVMVARPAAPYRGGAVDFGCEPVGMHRGISPIDIVDDSGPVSPEHGSAVMGSSASADRPHSRMSRADDEEAVVLLRRR